MELHSVACPFCSLHCDDLHLIYDGGHWKLISPACSLASRRFKIWEPVPGRTTSPLIQNATKILDKAHQILIVLTGDVEQETAIPAVNLARATSAYLVRDNNSIDENVSSAMQKAGLLSATLGDLRDRADQVVILGDDPEKSLPRFWEFVGSKKREKAVRINSKEILENIQHLRLQRRRLKTTIKKEITGIATRISRAGSGVVFVNSESITADVNELTEIMFWLKELGESKKWYGQILVPSTNATGVARALRSTTGYSGGLSFRRGITYHDPRLLQFESIIKNHEVDAIAIIGGVDLLPRHILEKLDGIKTIVISSEKPKLRTNAWLPCAQVGIDAPGTMSRLDGVPVKFEPLVNSGHASAQDYLDKLIQRVNI
jgi:formylmethanofuran dehydrogenase subunit B